MRHTFMVNTDKSSHNENAISHRTSSGEYAAASSNSVRLILINTNMEAVDWNQPRLALYCTVQMRRDKTVILVCVMKESGFASFHLYRIPLSRVKSMFKP